MATTSSSPSPRLSAKQTLYALQVRAFLNAAEDVDVDEETIDDLLDGFPDAQTDTLQIDIDGDDDDDTPTDDDNAEGAPVEEEELDLSGMDAYAEEAENAWSRQQVNGMIHHLKERGMASWVNEYVVTRQHPIPKLLYAFDICLCAELRAKRPKTLLYFLRVALSRQLRLREKLPQYNTPADAVDLIRRAHHILILTGAGISVSCGIPDFRSRDGLYASLKERGEYDLDDPQQMFDIRYFRENPAVFYSFASQIYPSNFTPSPCHRFIKLVEDKNKLLRNYTQNIDTLESLAGVRRALQCHGSFATASCLHCKRRVPGSSIEASIMARTVPLCTSCSESVGAPKPKKSKKGKGKERWDEEDEDEEDDEPDYPPWIMKPDITFFGEKLSDEFDRALAEDRERVDLLLVIGTSLKVAPVADILSHLPHSVPQILINKTPVRHINPDVVLLGNADDIVQYISRKLGWELPPPVPSTSPTPDSAPPSDVQEQVQTDAAVPEQGSKRRMREPQRVGNSHVWMFEGAEGGRWAQDVAERSSRDVSEARGEEEEEEEEGREAKKARTR
ncbi:hypothetical protein PLICRDRAFT_177046 [Plicaturopsis crispa FD-325 SS-3]|nr:hypothetical protein PLICRDRAFT_177046 [Plicaturopsis crispa FD-325 SS-3]